MVIIKAPFSIIDEKIIKADTSGREFYLPNLIHAIRVFNAKCPIKGSLLDRNHIQVTHPVTHLTHKLRIEPGFLVAEIEFVGENKERLEAAKDNFIPKPIIVTPLSFENNTEEVISIRDVQLE